MKNLRDKVSKDIWFDIKVKIAGDINYSTTSDYAFFNDKMVGIYEIDLYNKNYKVNEIVKKNILKYLVV